MVHRRLLPRVINWKLAPKKSLSMTEMKRHNLVKKLLHTLILEERLKTTTAKAKFVQYYADRIMELAKEGTKEAYDKASQLVDNPSKVIPKLFGRMAARYQNHQDKPTRIILAGFRDYKKARQGPMTYPDAASMSILEFADSPRSVSFQLAKYSIDKVKQKLADIEDELYYRETIELIDPVTKQPTTTVKLIEKPLSKHEKIKLKKKETFIRNALAFFDYRIERTCNSFKDEIAYLKEQLSKVQEQVDRLRKDYNLEEKEDASLPEEYLSAMEANGFDVSGGKVKIMEYILNMEADVLAAEKAARKEATFKSLTETESEEMPSTTEKQDKKQEQKSESSFFSSFVGKLKNLGGKKE